MAKATAASTRSSEGCVRKTSQQSSFEEVKMFHVTRVRLPSGEERLVPSPELEKVLEERLKQNGPAIRRKIRRHQKTRSKYWFLKIINS